MTALAPLDARLKFRHVALALAVNLIALASLQRIALVRMKALSVEPDYFNNNPVLFDGRYEGYSYDVAKAHLKALGPAARQYYADAYYTIFDVFYPASLWIFGLLFLLWITRSGAMFAVPLRAGWRLAALAVPTAFFALDMSENAAVSRMLTFGDDPPRAVVDTANALTIVKSGAGALSTALAVVLLSLAAIAWLRRRPA